MQHLPWPQRRQPAAASMNCPCTFPLVATHQSPARTTPADTPSKRKSHAACCVLSTNTSYPVYYLPSYKPSTSCVYAWQSHSHSIATCSHTWHGPTYLHTSVMPITHQPSRTQLCRRQLSKQAAGASEWLGDMATAEHQKACHACQNSAGTEQDLHCLRVNTHVLQRDPHSHQVAGATITHSQSAVLYCRLQRCQSGLSGQSGPLCAWRS